MPTSDKKIGANRLNGKKSRGPRNTTLTRTNATRHGLLAAGITELDDAEGYQTMLRDLVTERNPVGTTEMFFVESAAVDMVRLRRARRLEAEYITSVLHPPIREPNPWDSLDEPLEGAIVDPGLPAVMSCENVQVLAGVFQRYESAITNKFVRILHELERLQRIRLGEIIPAPAALDVSVHHDTRLELGTMPSAQEESLGDKADTAMESLTNPLQEEVLGEQEGEDEDND